MSEFNQPPDDEIIRQRPEAIAPKLTGDDKRIHEAVTAWVETGREGTIDDTTARMIASQWHDGMSSAMYSFASTGRIDKEGLASEMIRNLLETDHRDDLSAEALEALTYYFVETGERDAVDGWNEATSW